MTARALPNFVYQALSGQPDTIYGEVSNHAEFFFAVADLVEGMYRLIIPTSTSRQRRQSHRNHDFEFPEAGTVLSFQSTELVFEPLPVRIDPNSVPRSPKPRILKMGTRRTLDEAEAYDRYFRRELKARRG